VCIDNARVQCSHHTLPWHHHSLPGMCQTCHGSTIDISLPHAISAIISRAISVRCRCIFPRFLLPLRPGFLDQSRLRRSACMDVRWGPGGKSGVANLSVLCDICDWNVFPLPWKLLPSFHTTHLRLVLALVSRTSILTACGQERRNLLLSCYVSWRNFAAPDRDSSPRFQ
jgi:hypothetical protein